jgi:hypothetical protein
MTVNIDNIPKEIKNDPAKLGAVILADKHLDLIDENNNTKALLEELWKNRSDEHWCFEMSSTIEAAFAKK